MGQQTGRRPLKGLSKAAETAVRKRRVFGRLRLSRWLKILRELARYDEAGELLRARNLKRAVASACILVLTIVLMLLFLGPKESFVVFVLMAVCAILASASLTYALISRGRLKNLDLADDFRTVLIPFLTAIREDVASRDKVRLNLDFGGPSEGKVVRQGDLPGKGKKRIHETVYSDPWCSLEAPLAAGNHITLDITNTYVCHDVRWSNPRGKSKRKIKWKKLVLVRAAMSPDAGRFRFEPSAAKEMAGHEPLKLKNRIEGEAAALKAKHKFKSVGSTPPAESIQPKEIVAMFLKLGSLIRPLSTGSQQT
jgi:hypothetical protein